MTTTIERPGRFALLRSSLVELPTQRPLDVACAGGSLWLTLDRDPRDLVLAPGERTRIEAPGRLLAFAFEDAVMEVAPVRLPRPAPRAAGAWSTRALSPA